VNETEVAKVPQQSRIPGVAGQASTNATTDVAWGMQRAAHIPWPKGVQKRCRDSRYDVTDCIFNGSGWRKVIFITIM